MLGPASTCLRLLLSASLTYGLTLTPLAASSPRKQGSTIPARRLADFRRKGIALQIINNNRLREYFSKAARRRQDFHLRAEDFSTCSLFSELYFYAEFIDVMEHPDTSPYHEVSDYRRDRYDDSILRDSRKIIVDINYAIHAWTYDKEYTGSMREFAAAKSKDAVLQRKCKRFIAGLSSSGPEGRAWPSRDAAEPA